MNAKKAIGISIIALFVYYNVLRGSKALAASLKRYSFVGMNVMNGTVDINVDMSITNPLMVGLTITGIVGDVYINGFKAGYVDNHGSVYLRSGSNTIVPMVVTINIQDASNIAVANLRMGQKMTFALDGKILVGDAHVAVPVQLESDLGGIAE